MNSYVLRCEADPVAARRLIKSAMVLTGEYLEDPEVLHDLELALCEAAFNVARHAYDGAANGVVEIRLKFVPGEAVDVEVVDWGKGFDGLVRYENAPPVSESGRGMFLIASLADNCEVRRQFGQNIVAIHKNIGKSSWKS